MCYGTDPLVFRIGADGELAGLKRLSSCDKEYAAWLREAIAPQELPGFEADGLPYYPGRQYKAIADKVCRLDESKYIVSTSDGILALVDTGDKSVFSLGPACSHGRVNGMAAVKRPGGARVYGVAGDRDDLGCVFTYDGKDGLRNLGRLVTDGYRYGNAASCELSCCAFDSTGEVLAIGAMDRLGCVYLCKL